MALHTQLMTVGLNIRVLRFPFAAVAVILLGLISPMHTTALDISSLYSSSAGGCVVPLSSTALTPRQPQSSSWINPEWYANAVVGATQVINPQGALGVPDGGMAILTDTSILTLSFPSPFISGIAVRINHPTESTCDWVSISIRHFTDLTQTPVFTTDQIGYYAPGEYGVMGEGLSAIMAPHPYVVISFNTLTLVDAVYYVIPAKHYWLPVIMRNSS